MKQIKSKKLIMWCIIFVFSLIMCMAFLKPHYTHDTYEVISERFK